MARKPGRLPKYGMSIPLIGMTEGQDVAAGATRYLSPTGMRLPQASENGGATLMPANGTVKNLYMRVYANTASGTSTITLMVGGAATGITFTVGAGATGTYSDIVHEADITSGDDLSIRVVVAAGTGTISFAGFGVVFESD